MSRDQATATGQLTPRLYWALASCTDLALLRLLDENGLLDWKCCDGPLRAGSCILTTGDVMRILGLGVAAEANVPFDDNRMHCWHTFGLKRRDLAMMEAIVYFTTR